MHVASQHIRLLHNCEIMKVSAPLKLLVGDDIEGLTLHVVAESKEEQEIHLFCDQGPTQLFRARLLAEEDVFDGIPGLRGRWADLVVVD